MFKKIWSNLTSQNKPIKNKQLDNLTNFSEEETSRIDKAKEYIKTLVKYPQSLKFDDSYTQINDNIVFLRFIEEGGTVKSQQIKIDK